MNAISEAHGQDDRRAAERFVSSGFFMLIAVALLILAGFAAVYPFIPWERVFNVQSPRAIQEAGPAIAVFIVCFLANLPLGVVRQVQLGYQEGFATSLWESAGRVLGLAGLLRPAWAGWCWPWLARRPWPGCLTVSWNTAAAAPGCVPGYRITTAPAPGKFCIPVFFFNVTDGCDPDLWFRQPDYYAVFGARSSHTICHTLPDVQFVSDCL
jgi:hypothetical protein